MKEAKSYCVTNFGNYAEGFGTLRASGGDIGGGSEMLVVEPLIIREDITIKVDGGVLRSPWIRCTDSKP